ncbi:hypothetical protein FRC17_000610 [Serendipita sp. 399]|nr:hypothetical protein FRC17_000610 [Serendipita sp. 399]
MEPSYVLTSNDDPNNLSSSVTTSTSIYERNPNESRNRCPTGFEREELVKWVRRDQEEIARNLKEQSDNNGEITRCLTTIQDNEESLVIIQALLKSTEVRITTSRQVSELLSCVSLRDTENLAQNASIGSSIHLQMVRRYHEASETNEVELEDLLSTLNDLDMRRGNLEADLEATRSILAIARCRNETLVASEKAIQQDLSRKLQILSAHRRFPSELWGEIFAFIVADAEEQFRLGSRVGTPPFSALTLSAVCHLWREIAFGRPELWQHVAICSSKIRHNEARTEHYLSRIRDKIPPIVYTYSSINFIPPNRAKLATWPFVSRLLCGLNPKLKLLDIALDIPFVIHRNFLPSLNVDTEELLLRKQSGKSTLPIFVHRHRIQHLKSLTCHRIQLLLESEFSPDPALLPSPNDQLKLRTITFTDSELQYGTLIGFCREAPSLAHLNIRTSELIYQNSRVGVAGLTFRALRKLSLQSTHLPAFSSESLVPNLEEVDLTCRSYAILDWNEFIAVGSRSQALRTLTLRACIDEVTSESLEDLKMTYESILVSLPKLGCLHIYGESGGGEVLLTAKGLLRLERLVLHHSDVHDSALAELLMEAYQSRQDPISLTFDQCRHIDSPHAGYLAQLRPNSEDNQVDFLSQDFSSMYLCGLCCI